MDMVFGPPRWKKVSRSVRESQDRAAELLARQQRHENVSLIYRQALDHYLSKELGRYWERDLESELTAEVA